MCLWSLHSYSMYRSQSSITIIIAAYLILVAFGGIIPVAMLTDKCHGFHRDSIRARASEHVQEDMDADARVAYTSFLRSLETAPSCIRLPVFQVVDSHHLKYYGMRITALLPALYAFCSGLFQFQGTHSHRHGHQSFLKFH